MDANIILGGQQFDLLGAMDRGMQLANNQNALARQREIEQLYKTQGNALMQGDTNALGQLAQFDPAAAQGMLAQKQEMDFSAETMAMRREESRRAAEAALAEQAANLTAEQLAAEQAALSEALQGGAFFYQNKDEAGYNNFLQSKGIDPAQFPFQAFPAHAAAVEGVLDAMKTFAPPDPNERFKVVGGSLFDLSAEGGPAPVGQGAMQETTVFGPDGKPVMVQGGPGSGVKFTEAQTKDNAFATRADGALRALEGPSNPNDPASPPLADALADLAQNTAERIPLVGNYMLDETFQTARTAGDEFLQAILRKDTGAAITAPEQQLYGVTYLPQPGDGPRRLAYKKEARARAVEAIKSGMGAAQIEAMARADQAVVTRLGEDGAATSGTPQPGMVEDGFRFKGGDPADPENWEPAQ